MSTSAHRFCLILAGITALGSACAPQRMAVPADVAGALEELPVTERSAAKGALARETFKVAPYAVTDVDRDWNATKSSSVGSFSREKTAGGYNWVFEADAIAAKGQCAIEASEKSIGLMAGLKMSRTASRIGCTCDFGGALTEVILNADNKQKYAGELKTRGGATMAIKALYEREGTMNSPDPTGFRVDGDSPIGAVDVLGTGRIWLDAKLEAADRADLVCLFSGLMLYIPPSDN